METVPWTEIFRSKGSIYALEESTKDWVPRGTSGIVIVLQNPNNHQDVRIKFEKHEMKKIWWRLTSSRIKPKGKRALVLKAWSVERSAQEILAIRFSDQQSAIQFAKKYHDIYPMAISDEIAIENIFEERRSSAVGVKNNAAAHPKRNSAALPNLIEDFNNNYPPNGFAPHKHRMSGPPPAPSRHKKAAAAAANDKILHPLLENENFHMMRHYSEPLPPQPQMARAQKKRVVKALPGVRPPVFNAAHGQLQNNNAAAVQFESWKCAVCTYQNQSSLDKCSMCGLSAGGGLDNVDDNVIYDDSDYCDLVSGDVHKWQCSACTFGNHEWMERCEVCSAKRQLVNHLEDGVASHPVHNEVAHSSWSCPVCTLLNAGTNMRCLACNTQRGGGGAAADAVGDDDDNYLFNGSFNEYGSFQPQIYSNEFDRMMNIGMGVSGNPYNINLQYDFNMDPQYDMNAIFESTVEDFSRAASDIMCYNGSPSAVFSTLRSVAKKLLKDDARYRTLDTTNPKVMERLIGFEGVLDFLQLLGFESDAMGMKLICTKKPSRIVVNNAISVLNSYQQRFRMTDNGFQQLSHEQMVIDIDDDDDDDKEPVAAVKTQGGLEDLVQCVQPEKKNDILALDQIVLWSTHENMQDNDTMETLMMTHKLFTDSVTLLAQLRKRFFVPIPEEILMKKEAAIREFQTGVQKRIQLKVIKGLRDWMKHYWKEDFHQNSAVQQELEEWLRELQNYDELDVHNINCIWMPKLHTTVSKEYSRLREIDWEAKLDKKLDIFAAYDDVDLGDEAKLNTVLAKHTAEEIADQITLMDYNWFSQIEPRECVHQRWKDSNNKRDAPHILSLIQQFNKLTIFVQIQILQERGLRRRSTAIKRIVKMGQHFEASRNYNSLCAIFSALNSAPIHRLKLAWARVPERIRAAFHSWSVIFCRDFNHRNLRQRLRKAGASACIPHIGVYLQDLVFIDEGNKDKTEIEAFNGNKMLNFNKCVRIADRIKNLQLFQHHKYGGIIANKKIQKILLIEFEKLKDTTDDQIWDMSTSVKKQDQKEAKQPLGFFGGGGANKNAAPNAIPPVRPENNDGIPF